jgi:hypothetical protein
VIKYVIRAIIIKEYRRYFMKKIKGIVEEVYIPTGDNQDIMFSNKIGFNVKTENGKITIEDEQNKLNAEILKGDKVIITKQIISNNEFIDIEKIKGDEYE